MSWFRWSMPYWTPPAGQLEEMGLTEIALAKERGRQGAALIYMTDPEKRAEAERIFGLPYMRRTYPEAYRRRKHWIDRLTWWGE